jgi:hypothetical protein
MLHRPTHPNGYVSHEFPQFCGNWARKNNNNNNNNSTQIPTQKAKNKIKKTSAMNSTVHFPLVVTRLREAMGAQKPIKPKHQDFKGKDFDNSERSQKGVPEAIACLQSSKSSGDNCHLQNLFFSAPLLFSTSLARSLARPLARLQRKRDGRRR